MKLLFVDCCISQRGENSRTAALAKAYLEGFRSAHPDAQVETVTPETLLNLRPFDVPALNEREPWPPWGRGMPRSLIWPGSSAGRTGLWWRRPSGI
ncbi:MAG: hypothetical protein V8R55_06560 [Dysosmobacter sp.]